ncbi:MAG: hypothetical protein IJN08_00410 [Clostridia bacterium]|nr:hypothetical protein [Clostridia bacterium]
MNNGYGKYQTLLLGLGLLMLGMGAGYSVGREQGAPRERIEVQELAAEAEAPAAAEESFAVTTVNIFRCGHILERQEGEVVTTSRLEETMESYGGYNFELKDGVMALYREYDYCCPEHYYTGGAGETVTVYKTDATTLQKTEVCTLDIPPDHEAYREMGQGMVFDGLEEVNLYMEGIDE